VTIFDITHKLNNNLYVTNDKYLNKTNQKLVHYRSYQAVRHTV